MPAAKRSDSSANRRGIVNTSGNRRGLFSAKGIHQEIIGNSSGTLEIVGQNPAEIVETSSGSVGRMPAAKRWVSKEGGGQTVHVIRGGGARVGRRRVSPMHAFTGRGSGSPTHAQ